MIYLTITDPEKYIYKVLKGKSYDDVSKLDRVEQLKVYTLTLGLLVYQLILVLMLFWCGYRGLKIATYYAIGLVCFYIISIAKNSIFKNKKPIPAERKWYWSVIRYATGIFEIFLLSWAIIM